MKSTTGIKKTAKGKQTKVTNYKFWLVLSCVALVGVWYLFMVFSFFGVAALANSSLAENFPGMYELLINATSILALYVASFASLPFAVVVFKRLKIEVPVVSAIAFFMALTFGFTLFASLTSAIFYESAIIPLVFIVSMLIAGLLYGVVIRYLKHQLPKAKFLSIAIGLTFIPVALWVLYRLWVTTQI
jgi:hypothetical protein